MSTVAVQMICVNESYRQEKQVDADIVNILTSVRELLNKYKMYSKTTGETPATSGGLQQFIISKLKKKGDMNEKTLTQRLKALYIREDCVKLHFGQEEEEKSMFDCLPVDIRLHIFAYLDVRTLCRACSVSRDWNQLLWDDQLWHHRLTSDKFTWSQVSHSTNPQLFTEAASNLAAKEIYLRCSPEVLAQQREESSAFHQVSTALKFFIPRKAPKVAMFGPGLESSSSGIVHKLLYEEQNRFTRVAMFPGQFDGFGAGMTLQLPNSHTFHLIVLYTASKQERESRSQQDRLTGNRLLNQQTGSSREEEMTYELQPALQQLYHTLNAFIFVVDATSTKQSMSSSRKELHTMVQERWASPQVPVLVLSCVPVATSPRLPAVEVVEALQLTCFTRPWLVIDCVVDTLHNVDKGVLWIIETCQRK